MRSLFGRRPRSPEALLARFRATGDPAALAALFDRTAPDLFRVALAVAPDAATAEEAVQETFLAVLEDPSRCDPSEPVMPWLATVLRHKVLDARRRARRVPDPLRVEPRLLPEDPADAAARKEAVDRVRAALNRLEEPYRSVALLRWEYGLEPGEIAHARGEPPGTVRSTLSRALERLRKDLGGVVVLGILLGVRPPSGLATIRNSLLAKAGVPAAGAVAAGGVVVGFTAVAAGIGLSFLAGGIAGGTIAISRRPDAPPREAPVPGVRAGPAAPAAVTPPPLPPPAQDGPPPALRLLDDLDGTWLTAFKVGGRLAVTEPADAILAAVRDRWPRIGNPVDRRNLMKGFAFSLGPRRLEVVDLGYRDPDPVMRAWACNYLEPYSGRRFDDDPAGYAAWRASVAGVPLDDLLCRTADDLLGTLRASPADGRRDLLGRLLDVAWRLEPASPARAPILAAAEEWIEDPSWLRDPEILLRLVDAAHPPEARARALFEALLQRGGEPERRALLLAGRLEARWAADALVQRLRSPDAALASAAAGALADIGDIRSTGPLVEALAARGDDAASIRITAALVSLTGVRQGEFRDAAWWSDWWTRNRGNLEESR